MRPWASDAERGIVLHHGDCMRVLRELPDASIDAVVTDPPYGLGFMGKDWDRVAAAHLPPSAADRATPLARMTTGKGPAAVAFDGPAFQAWCEEWAVECLRVLKPGGHLLAFGGTRTWHRLACAVEDAGYEIRDGIAWLHGQGFPKSADVPKALMCDVMPRVRQHAWDTGMDGWAALAAAARPAFDALLDGRWRGFGTAMKPAFEPVVVGRKPLAGTVAGNVIAYGTGALNIDGCRVATSESDRAAINAKHAGMAVDEYERRPGAALNLSVNPMPLKAAHAHDAGRWPSNVVLTHSAACTLVGVKVVKTTTHYPAERGLGGLGTAGHAGQGGLVDVDPATERVIDFDCAPDCPVAMLDAQSGVAKSGIAVQRNGGGQALFGGIGFGTNTVGCRQDAGYDDFGGASRFFPTFRYHPKADRDERPIADGVAHPTVKPLDLMRWLVRLVCPPGGVVLDPFAGSGTTMEAAKLERVQCIGIERAPEYLPLIVARMLRDDVFYAHAVAPPSRRRRDDAQASLFDEGTV